MLRVIQQRWPSGSLGILGWVLLSVATCAVALISARLAAASPKNALLGMAGLTGLILLMTIIPNPRIGPYIVFGMMPAMGWAYKQSPGSGLNFLVDALVIVAFTGVLLRPKERRMPQALGLPIIFLFLLGVVQLFNPASGGNEVTAFYAFRENLLPMLLFFVGFYAFRSVRQAEHFSIFLMVIALWNGAWAMKQIFFGPDDGENIWAKNNDTFFVEHQLRAFSTFDAPWGYAYYTDVAFVLGVCLLFATRSWVVRGLVLVALLFDLAGMYLSIVRTSWILVPVALVVIFLLRFRHPLRPAAILVTAGTCVAMFAAMVSMSLPTGQPNPDPLAQALAEFNILEDESMQGRFRSWSVAVIPMAIAYPLGKGQGTASSAGIMNPSGAVVSDNTYLMIAIEFGWVGVGVYLFLLGAALWYGLRWYAQASDRSASWLLTAAIAVIIVTIISDLTNDFVGGASGSYLFFLLGLMAFAGTSPSAQRSPPLAATG